MRSLHHPGCTLHPELPDLLVQELTVSKGIRQRRTSLTLVNTIQGGLWTR
jgi:hypothetical protein